LVPFEELALAYKQGKRAKNKGRPITSNPYNKPKDKASKNHAPYYEWQRGWLSGKK